MKKLSLTLKSQLYLALQKWLNRKEINKKVEEAKKLINCPSTIIVSFDVFDTLLVRLFYDPIDIFRYMALTLDENIGIDFYKIRTEAEIKIKKQGFLTPTLEEIYSFIEREYNLEHNTITCLMSREIDLEMNFSIARKAIYDLYLYANECGKKIIAISDMYINSEYITSMLRNEGYDNIQKVYVSCECKCTKRDGLLFTYVANSERVLPKQIVHIGNNLVSDFLVPKMKGFNAVYVSSAYNRFIYSSSRAVPFIISNFTNLYDRLLFSYILIVCETYGGLRYKRGTLNLEIFAITFLLPILCQIISCLISNDEINHKYKYIYFLSRDGWLPFLAYNMAREQKGKGLPGKYIYGSRFNLRNGLILEEKLKKRWMDYYREVIELKDNRALIYDTGYSGSVSNIAAFINEKCKIDKFYLYEKAINREIDQKEGTVTYCLLGDLYPNWMVFLETLFSTIEYGSVKDVLKERNEFNPVCDSLLLDDKCKAALSKIQNTALLSLKSFLDVTNHISLKNYSAAPSRMPYLTNRVDYFIWKEKVNTIPFLLSLKVLIYKGAYLFRKVKLNKKDH